ncbi:MAG: flagellar filament capping protein FliD [Bacillota bacterium]|nr:flagellar filament capping protein FliD [Bacillota bacterium]
MSMNVNSLRTPMRFGGLASGLDTEQMVKDLMKVEKHKVDRLKQDKQIVEWRKEQHREMISSLQAFKRDFFDRANPKNLMLSPNAYRTFEARSSASDTVTATANANASAGRVVIDRVEQLADSARMVSSVAPGLDTAVTASSTLSITVRGQKVEVAITEGMTHRQVMAAVNNSNAGVRMTYNSFTERYTVATTGTGSEQALMLEGSLFDELGLGTPTAVTGQDAVFVIAGASHSRSGNTFTADGVTYNLNKVSNGEVTITVAQDVEKAFQNIKGFIDKYNELIEKINGKTSEKRFSDFRPLTDEQRGSLKDKELEQWDDKAKSGLLNGDALLRRLTTEMRRALADTVSGSGVTLSSIGITTGGYHELGKLHIDETKLRDALANNSEQVMDMFSRGSDIAYSPNMSAADRTTRYRESGLAVRLADILEDNIRTTRDSSNRKGVLLERAGISGDATEFKNLFDDELKRISARIDRANDMLQRREDRYWKQFTALEKAMNQMNAQSAWIAQQFSSK